MLDFPDLEYFDLDDPWVRCSLCGGAISLDPENVILPLKQKPREARLHPGCFEEYEARTWFGDDYLASIDARRSYGADDELKTPPLGEEEVVDSKRTRRRVR